MYGHVCMLDKALRIQYIGHKQIKRLDSPFNACDEEDEVAVDFGAIDKLLNVAGIYRLSRLKAAGTYTITHWTPQRLIKKWFTVSTFNIIQQNWSQKLGLIILKGYSQRLLMLTKSKHFLLILIKPE